MKELDCHQCQVHVVVCTNERPEPKSCCRKVGGQELYFKLKNKLKDTGLIATHWATRTGCLGFCNDVGATITVHRKGEPSKWFSEVTDADFDAIWKEITR